MAKDFKKRGSHDTANVKLKAYEKRQTDHVQYQPIGVRARERQAAAARRHGSLKPMRFVSLHHHSTFSFLDGFQLPEAHVRRATEVNMGALAMTEHGNIFSHVKLEAAAEEQGIKPIFGCEFYCGWTDEKRRTQRKNHLTVIAKTTEGYMNLLALVNRSWKEGFYYEPTVDWGWLEQHQKGLIILSGCNGSALFTACVGGKHVEEKDAGYRRGLSVARWMSSRFDDFYIEVQAFPELEKTRLANPILARIAKTINRPLVATLDCHYTAPEEGEIQAILHNCRPGEQKTLEQQVQDWGYEVPLCHPPTDRAVYRRLRGTGLSLEQASEAIVSTEEIAQSIDVTLPKLPGVEFPVPEGEGDKVEFWRKLLKAGWRYRGCHELPPEERDRYKKQLAIEMELIETKGYVNYFLIVQDAIVYAKEQQIPIGPARGSAAASLACYLLRITEIDPMLYDNLLFSRFIDWTREDMPDIDIDFATYGRSIVRDYLLDKYGEGCVNNVGTFTMYKSKVALNDAARVHKVPKKAVETVKELLLERSSGDLRASATIEDTVDQFEAAYKVFQDYPELQYAMDLEGNAKDFSVHAAGLVISTEPITSVTAVIEREVPKGSGNIIQVVSMDKRDAERQGLEKLDFLGLSTMDMIAEAMHQLDMTVEDLYAIPMDDPEVIDGFRRNDVAGIFQFDGRATRMVNGAVKPDDFNEISLLIALSRPGPLHNGAVEGYVKVKYGGEAEAEAAKIHPALDEITEDVNYQIVYQEQIMRIVRQIGGFDDAKTAQIRKIIARKKGEQEFNRQKEKFLEGATTYHERRDDIEAIDRDVATRIWGMCITAGAYSFNASHSVSYAKLAYWCMWLKQKHPAAYFQASLAKLKNDDKLAALRRDAVKGNGPREPIEVLPPAPFSDVTWSLESNTAIRAGWSQITGIGEKTAAVIGDHLREVGPLSEWEELQAVPGIGPKKVATIREFAEARDPFGIHAIDEAIEAVSGDLASGIADAQGNLPTPTHGAEAVIDAEAGTRVVFLGQPVHRNLRDIFEANRAMGEELRTDLKRPDLSQWVVLTARDGDEMTTFICSRFKYPKFKKAIWELQVKAKQLVLIEGKKSGMTGNIGDKSGIVFMDNLWVLEPDEEEE